MYKYFDVFHRLLAGFPLLFLAASAVGCGGGTISLEAIRGDLELNEETPLMQAASDGDLSLVESLISEGSEVNAQSEEMWTPLHYACYEGHADVARKLIAEGADIGAMDDYLFTPLHLAAFNGRKEVATVLIEHGADVNAEDGYSSRPLQHALSNSHDEVAGLLLAYKATIVPIDNTPDGLYITGRSYLVKARQLENKNELDSAAKSYELARDYFEKAGHEYDGIASGLRNERIFKEVLTAAGNVAAEYGAQLQAEQMARQMADASPNGKGIGMATYIIAEPHTASLQELQTAFEAQSEKCSAYKSICTKKLEERTRLN